VFLGAVRLVVFGVDTFVTILAAMLASLCDRDARLAFRMAQWWAWLNLKLVCARVTIEGFDHLDPRRSYVFVSNHRSNLDVLALIASLWEFQLRWVAKEELFRIPLFGWGLRATKQILVNRADHAQAMASLAEAKKRMHDGISVVFFPEGTRGGSGTMLPFKKGSFVFALETGAPIVPIAISGTERLLPRAAWTVQHGGEIRVALCPPIETASRSRDDRDALLAEVRAVIERSVERLDGRAETAGAPGSVSTVGLRSPARP